MENSESRQLNGTAAIENGKVLVTNPFEGGQPAVLIPGEHVIVMFNGQQLTKPQEVKAEDQIQLLPKETLPQWTAQIRLSDDKMAAYLVLERSTGEVFTVGDSPPAFRLDVKAVIKERIKPQITAEDIISVLKAKGIIHGILPKVINIAIESDQEVEYIVAKGDPPLPGKDAAIRKIYEEKNLNSEQDASLMRYFNLISVEAGEPLVEIIPPEPGKNGTDVLGNIVSSPPPKTIDLRAGKGAVLSSDGTKASAAIAGNPVLKGTIISVSPVYALTGDVDTKTGHINFKGDITIYGNVQDGMKVTASGKVLVNGFVGKSLIVAGGDVLIQQNMVGGTARAGGAATVYQKLHGSLLKTKDILKRLKQGVKQLKENSAFAHNQDVAKFGDGVLLRVLLDSKFKKLPLLLQEIGQELEKLLSTPNEELEFFQKSYINFRKEILVRISTKLNTASAISEFIEKFLGDIDQFLAVIGDEIKDKSKLVIPYAQNSHLESSGDVLITGKGCYSSNIYAGGNVVIYGSPGVFRGGEITAEGSVKVRELGSHGEALTMVSVKKGKWVVADKVFPGVTVKVGSRTEKFSVITNGVQLRGE
ncbi:FapA family protein [Bacillota bacterium LX-D]|nr:FapA family protein [Bacillota bacterium LX-D]